MNHKERVVISEELSRVEALQDKSNSDVYYGMAKALEWVLDLPVSQYEVKKVNAP